MEIESGGHLGQNQSPFFHVQLQQNLPPLLSCLRHYNTHFMHLHSQEQYTELEDICCQKLVATLIPFTKAKEMTAVSVRCMCTGSFTHLIALITLGILEPYMDTSINLDTQPSPNFT